MGCCLSCSEPLSPCQQPLRPQSAMIIAVNGELKDCPTPINVAQLLNMVQPQIQTVADHEELKSSASSCTSFGYVLCNSDSLCYDEHIPAMKADEDLQPNQIYFLIPASRLQHRLSAADMAAMAVKASAALQKRDGKHKRAHITPVPADCYQHGSCSFIRGQKTIKPKPPFGSLVGGSSSSFARSGSVRRLQRYSSKRARLAVRSFRLMLSTIYE
uniref:Uncharacterized protein n=1 Tax=Kalanchoe fedtschenkoi TaxID=63787 RepID=A0A7N0TNU9_KALFE